MKCISIFLFSAAAVCAADFTTGQAARLVIGQSTFTSQDSNSSDTILGGASGLAFAADTLFVADSNRVGASPSNHRVLLFQNASGMSYLGTLKSWIYRPVFQLFGTGVSAMRAPMKTTFQLS